MEGLQYLFTSKIGLRASQSKNQYARTTKPSPATLRFLRESGWEQKCLSAWANVLHLNPGGIFAQVQCTVLVSWQTILQKSAKPILAIPYLKSEPLFVHKTHKHTHTRALSELSHTHTHERALRTVIANLVVECILHAKTLPLTGMGRWRGPTKYQEATIAIASENWSNWISSWRNWKFRHAGSWLSRSPFPVNEVLQEISLNHQHQIIYVEN